MAEFRKLFYALGVAALLAGVSTTAVAQSITCSQGSGATPAQVRSESFADLVGDFVLDCIGGTPTPAGTIVPPVNITVTLNTQITSKILDTTYSAGGNFTEALLIIDDPNATPNNNARPLLACGDPNGAPYDPSVPGTCRIIAPAQSATGNSINTYDGTAGGNGIAANCTVTQGTGTTGIPMAFGCGRPNVFQGRQGLSSGNTNVMRWDAVPFDPPGPIPATTDNLNAGHRKLRIVNIRANSPAFSGGFLQPEITMSINISGNGAIFITAPTQRVANVFTGLQPVTLAPALSNFVQCISESRLSVLRFREGFSSSFKPKGLEQYVANGTTANVLKYQTTNPSTYVPGVTNQNVPSASYYSESGFVSTTGGVNPPTNPPPSIGTVASTGNGVLVNPTGITTAGIATQGTRLAVTFSNLPLGMTISVQNVVQIVDSSSQARTGVAVRTTVVSARGDGPFAAISGGSISVVSGDMLVYEVLYAEPGSLEELVIPVSINNPASNLSSDLPEVNKVGQVAGGFAPFILATDDNAVWSRPAQGSATVSTGFLPVPRFRNTGTPVDLFRVNKCSCNLLFPFISNAPAPDRNYDTGIALANTSLTPGAASTAAQRFGFVPNTSQSGPVQFWFYPANESDPPVATKCTNTVSPDTCPSPTTGPSAVKAGETLLYVLSSGSARWGLKGAPGFTGYMIAQASFQYCHAFAYISPQGATPLTNGMSVGYLALQLDKTNTLPSRTGLPSEVLSH